MVILYEIAFNFFFLIFSSPAVSRIVQIKFSVLFSPGRCLAAGHCSPCDIPFFGGMRLKDAAPAASALPGILRIPWDVIPEGQCTDFGVLTSPCGAWGETEAVLRVERRAWLPDRDDVDEILSNHGVVWVGRGFKNHPVPPLAWAG